jgi:hypothetical protein
MGELVREHALQLVVVKPALDATGNAQHRVIGVAAGRERVRDVGVGDRHLGLGHVRKRADPVHHAVQLGCLSGVTTRAPAVRSAILSE